MDALELVAKLKMDISDYEQGLDDAKSKAEGFGGKVLGGLGKVGMAVGKATMVAVGAAASGVAAITKMAVDNYATYEQVSEGTKLLFGDASDYIMNKSQEAYKNVQMSQNDYLTQVNGFAVGLRESLGGNEQAAAKLADKIVTAEADIVAATGQTQENVQNAFNGIMKGNFTMVDNLNLGLKPTKEGYQEMIDKVNEWNASQGHATDYQMDNLADMEAALVDYVEMQGLAEYAANEGATTIQGSLASMRGAWSDFLTGLADSEADLGQRIDNLVDSASNVVTNVAPILEHTLESVGTAIEKIIPKLMDEVPNLINNTLPKLIESGKGMIEAILQGLQENMDSIVEGAVAIGTTLIEGVGEILPMLLEVGLQILLGLANGIAQALPELIPTIVDVMLQIVTILLENLPLILDAGLQIIMGLIQGLLNAIPNILAALPSIMAAITSWFVQSIPMIVTTGVQVLTALVENLPAIIEGICNAIPAIITACVEAFTSPSSLAALANAGNALFTALIKLAPQITATIITLVPQIITGLINAFIAAGPQMAEAGKNLMRGLGNGLSSMVGELSTKVKGIGSTIVSAAKSALGIHSPSTVFAEIGENTMLGYEEGVEQEALNTRRTLEKSLDFSNMETSIGVSANVSSNSGVSRTSGSSADISRRSYAGDTFIIPVYIGGTNFGEMVIEGQTLENYRSGGR